jgi:hypothetical protein
MAAGKPVVSRLPAHALDHEVARNTAMTAAVMPSVLAIPASKAPSRRLLDFRPVLRNRTAMGWIVGYTVHTWELSALRAWGVTFLAAVCASQGAPSWLPDPTVLFTIAGLAGIAVSVTGNETAQRWGVRASSPLR